MEFDFTFLTDNFSSLSIKDEPLFLSTPPSILVSSHLRIKKDVYDIIIIINEYLEKNKYCFRFFNKKYDIHWKIQGPDREHDELIYKYILVLYKNQDEYIIEIIKIYGNDDTFSTFFNTMKSLFWLHSHK
jgi:hypothetical protein